MYLHADEAFLKSFGEPQGSTGDIDFQIHAIS